VRSETELRKALKDCGRVSSFGLSEGPCPQSPDGERGCCAECSFPSTIIWVLGDIGDSTANGQSRLIDAIGLLTTKTRKRKKRK